ncbi:MAG TPA: NAD(P)-dependent alcohol dehydrogenase, partial [Rhodanobacteraceae bacterium]|nr:NAD(P)-dependent alcohol dehydrogenase [Rhodanobacteraceae bacterium]
IAKSFGAEVTGVCSTKNLDMVRKIGADHVVDYTKEDVTAGQQRYDLIVDTVGTHSLLDYRRVMSPKGIYVMVGGSNDNWLVGLLGTVAWSKILSSFVDQKFGLMLAELNPEDLKLIGDLMQSGKVTPVIDKTYSLKDVPEALRYLEQGHARGKVVISLAAEDQSSLANKQE